jgi:hypothetical protein
VEAADDADGQRQQRDTSRIEGPAGSRAARAPEQEPEPQRQQQQGQQQSKDLAVRRDLDADDRAADDAWERAEGQLPYERTPQPTRAPVASQGAGDGHHVVDEVGRRDRRAGHVEHADLDRQEEHRSRDADRDGQHGDDEGEQPAEAGHLRRHGGWRDRPCWPA